MTTVVIVPGSFSIPSLYDSFVQDLEKNGVRAVVVKLASVGRKETPGTLSDDVDSISEVVTPLLDAGQEVVLLTHSYGGVPGSQSLEKLSDKARQANGGKGIKKIIYMASVILPVGTSNMDATRASIPDWMTFEVGILSIALIYEVSNLFIAGALHGIGYRRSRQNHVF